MIAISPNNHFSDSQQIKIKSLVILALNVALKRSLTTMKDHKYLPWLQEQMINNGLVELFFTSDGGAQLKPANLLKDMGFRRAY